MAYRHVLTIYDGSTEAEDLLDMVCRIVKPHRAKLTILLVPIVPHTESLPQYEPDKDPRTDALISRAERFAEKRGVRAAHAVRYARALGPAVVEEARAHGVDLLALLAPDPQRLPTEEGLDTDTETVLREAACAVMLCRPSRRET
jgi:nucleotide-binding universal stress UspA family protein